MQFSGLINYGFCVQTSNWQIGCLLLSRLSGKREAGGKQCEATEITRAKSNAEVGKELLI